MSARDAILAALEAPGDAATIARDAAALLEGVERPAPPADLVAAFVVALAQPSIAATVARIATAADLPCAVAAYATQHGLPPVATLAAPVVSDWSGFTLTDHPPIDGGLVVTRAVAAVAETGSLILRTGPARPMLPDFLALHHVVMVAASDVVAQLEDIPAPATTPRAHYWITGVSGTTDIEGQYVRGAHGPRFLHVVIAG